MIEYFTKKRQKNLRHRAERKPFTPDSAWTLQKRISSVTRSWTRDGDGEDAGSMALGREGGMSDQRSGNKPYLPAYVHPKSSQAFHSSLLHPS